MRQSTKVMLAYLAVCFFWGSTYLAIRIGVDDFPPFVFVSIRHSISGLLMLLIAKMSRKAFPTTRHDLVVNALVGLFMLLGANGLVTYAEQWVDSGVAALMVSIVPVFIAIIEVLILRTAKISRQGILGLLLGFAGVYLLVRPSNGLAVIDPLGLSVLVVAGVLWAMGSILSTRVRAREALIANIGIQMLAGGMGCVVVSFFTGGIFEFEMTFRVAGALAYLITFGSIVGFSSYIYILQHWPATKAGTYAYVNPVVAVVLGAMILGEKMTPNMLVGMVVILGGVFLVQRSKIRID